MLLKFTTGEGDTTLVFVLVQQRNISYGFRRCIATLATCEYINEGLPRDGKNYFTMFASLPKLTCSLVRCVISALFPVFPLQNLPCALLPKKTLGDPDYMER